MVRSSLTYHRTDGLRWQTQPILQDPGEMLTFLNTEYGPHAIYEELSGLVRLLLLDVHLQPAGRLRYPLPQQESQVPINSMYHGHGN